MLLSDLNLMALEVAVLCMDCNYVSNGNRQCPACGGGVLMNLAAVLDRNCVATEDACVILGSACYAPLLTVGVAPQSAAPAD